MLAGGARRGARAVMAGALLARSAFGFRHRGRRWGGRVVGRFPFERLRLRPVVSFVRGVVAWSFSNCFRKFIRPCLKTPRLVFGWVSLAQSNPPQRNKPSTMMHAWELEEG